MEYLVHNEDCKQTMSRMEDSYIDLTVTSPPYDDLRTYEGYSFDFEKIANELFRVTKNGGVVVWNVNDATKKGTETGTSFKQVLYFMECGFKLHDTMIWIKDGGGAIGSNKCYTQNFEYMFVLVKGKINTYNLIRDKVNKSYGKHKGNVLRTGRRKATGELKKEVRKAPQQYSKRNNWWFIPPQKGDHPAVFPDQLARDHILTWSNEGDLVYDPFAGSGTVPLMSEQHNRKWLCSEISENYCRSIRTKINALLI